MLTAHVLNHQGPIMKTIGKFPKIEEIFNSEIMRKLTRPITPAVLEEAIEISRRLLERRRFNESTGESEYLPPLTDEELRAGLFAEQDIMYILESPESTYANPSSPYRKQWGLAMQKLLEHARSDLYLSAVRDVSRSRNHKTETASEPTPDDN